MVTVHDVQPLAMPEWTGGRPWPVRKAYDMFYGWAYPSAFRRADALIAVSRATRDALAALCPGCAAKTEVVHSGLPPDAKQPGDLERMQALRRAHDIPERYVLFIGSTRPNKNLPAMVRAFARLAGRRSVDDDLAFVLVLTPDRFMRDIHSAIHAGDVESAIRIVPPVDAADKRALYRGASALFFVTKHEGIGFPVLEAQAQATPVVASTAGSLPEVAGDGALLVDPDDVDAMAEALGHAVDDDAMRRDLIDKGRRNIARFSWERCAQRTLDIYRRVAQR